MANFREALEYAANNPQSDWAKAFGMEVATGRHDEEARQAGFDISSIKQQFLPQLEKKLIIEKQNKETEMANQRQTNANAQGPLESFSVGVAKSGLGLFKGLSQIGTKVGNFFLPKSLELNDLYSEEALKADAAQGGIRGKLLEENNLETKNIAEGIGKFAGDAGQFFIPAGEVNNVEKVLTEGIDIAPRLLKILGPKSAGFIEKVAKLGTKMAVRATEGGGIIAAQTGGDKKDTITAAGVSAAIPVLGGVFNKGAGYLKNYRQNLMGALSGRGKAVIEEIAKDPVAAIQGLTGESAETLGKDAQILKETAVGIREEAGKEYNRVLNNLQEIYVNEGKSFDKGTEINKITDLIDQKFGIKKAGKIAELTGEEVADKGALDYESSRFIKPADIGIINRAVNAVRTFRDAFDPKNMEALASKIDMLKGSDSDVNSVLHTITSSLRNSVAQMGEESGYKEGADLARNFAKAMDKLDDFTQKFKASPEDLRPAIGEKIGEKTGKVILTEQEKTKIAADLSTIFSGNKDLDKETLRKIVFGGQGILSREAGRTLKTAPEKASTKLGEFFREVIISPAFSPEKIGMMEAKLALRQGKLFTFIDALKKLAPAEKAAVLKLITENN